MQQIGAPVTAYQKPQSRFVADFLGAANFLEGELERSGSSHFIRLKTGERVPCGKTLRCSSAGRFSDVSLVLGVLQRERGCAV